MTVPVRGFPPGPTVLPLFGPLVIRFVELMLTVRAFAAFAAPAAFNCFCDRFTAFRLYSPEAVPFFPAGAGP